VPSTAVNLIDRIQLREANVNVLPGGAARTQFLGRFAAR
jgi:hypothetical protein